MLAPLLGSGSGANFALVMFSFGLLTIIGAVLCLLSPQIRTVEERPTVTTELQEESVAQLQ